MRVSLRLLLSLLMERDRPPDFSPPASGAHPLHGQLGIPSDLGGLHCFNTGSAIFANWDSLLRRLNRAVLPISEPEGTVKEWINHNAELKRIAWKFFDPAWCFPCFLFGHRLCWTDRCTVTYFHHGLFERAYDPKRDCRDYVHTDTVKLPFESYGLFRGPDNLRYIHVRPSRLLWHNPDGMSHRRVGFARVREQRSVVLPDGTPSLTYRYQLGVGSSRSRECDTFLRLGLHPALDGLIHCLKETGTQQGLLLVPSSVSARGVRIAGMTGSKGVVDSTGIYDVEILKLWRLWLWTGDEGECEPCVDELTFALHRHTGRMVYIAASRDRFGYAEPRDGTGWLWSWLGREFGVTP